MCPKFFSSDRRSRQFRNQRGRADRQVRDRGHQGGRGRRRVDRKGRGEGRRDDLRKAFER